MCVWGCVLAHRAATLWRNECRRVFESWQALDVHLTRYHYPLLHLVGLTLKFAKALVAPQLHPSPAIPRVLFSRAAASGISASVEPSTAATSRACWPSDSDIECQRTGSNGPPRAPLSSVRRRPTPGARVCWSSDQIPPCRSCRQTVSGHDSVHQSAERVTEARVRRTH